MVRKLKSGPRYVNRVVLQKLAPYSYRVEVQRELVWKCHVDHLMKLRDADEDCQIPLNCQRIKRRVTKTETAVQKMNK